ncbi:MAG TPA: DUF2252 family protein [Burkholderiaceae bacterium]|jgi:uncharacterized protein (DUF2252 family)
MDVIEQIRAANAGRDPQRLALKYAAMRADPFGFLRGSCALFYARLPRGGVFKSAPLAWSCGDLHLENFGSYKADNRLAYFDLNDFDEAALAPASWDLVRLLTSVLIGTEPLVAGAADATALCRVVLDAYATALTAGKAYWVERDTASGLVGQLLASLRARKRPAFLDTRTTLRAGKRRLLVDGRKAFDATADERRRVTRFLGEFAATQADPGFYKTLDVARRIAGTGSLGVERYVILVKGKGSPDGNYLLDLKAALPSALTARLKTPQPRWATPAQRVATLQQRLQAAPMAFLRPVVMDGRPFVLRALQPAEDRVSLVRANTGHLTQLMADLGRIVAWAQLRSAGRQGSANLDELIDFGSRKKWKPALLDAALAAADQLRRDAAVFNAACDDGALKA